MVGLAPASARPRCTGRRIHAQAEATLWRAEPHTADKGLRVADGLDLPSSNLIWSWGGRSVQARSLGGETKTKTGLPRTAASLEGRRSTPAH